MQPSDEERSAYYKRCRTLLDGGISDFTSAARLADTIEAEKAARLKLFRIGCSADSYGRYSSDQQEQDYEWLRKNLDGYELGEIIYLYVSTWELLPDYGWSSIGEQLVGLMDEAIKFGYSEPSVFHLRAQGHIISGNYGMAVKDIDKALTNIDQQNVNQIVELLVHQAQALCNMGRFDEAHQVLSRARDIDENGVKSHIMIGHGLDKRVLCECALEHEFYERALKEPMNTIVKILMLWEGRSVYPNLYSIKKECPWILQYLKEIVGADLWNAMQNNPNLTISVPLPRI